MLTSQQRTRLLEVARQSLRAAVGSGPEPDLTTDDPDLTRPSGAFVTLKSGGRLRGCIGYVEPIAPLIDTVRQMARAAALEDPRFQPVGASEEPGIDIEVSAMSPIEPVEDLSLIEVGRHGLIAEEGGRRGLLLPQVAAEWGWTAEEFVQHTCQKAGLASDAHERGAKFYWFEAEVFGEGGHD